MRKLCISMCVSLLALGVPACSSDDGENGRTGNNGNNGNNGGITDTDGSTDMSTDDVTDADTDPDDAGDTEDGTGDMDMDAADGEDGDGDTSDGTGDIVLDGIAVTHQQDNEWILAANPRNDGDAPIELSHCRYEARTVEENTEIATGSVYTEGGTLQPGEDAGDNTPIIRFEQSPDSGTVQAMMVVECLAADGEEEEDTSNNLASGQFRW